jgi:hypothetical protein
MPYFFILPAFVLWVAALGVAIVVTSLHRPAVWFRPYVVSVLVWSSLGFVLSTIVYAGVLVAAAVAMDRLLPGRASIIGGIGMGLVIFLGPFVAAAVGLFGGTVIGMRRTRRKVLCRTC